MSVRHEPPFPSAWNSSELTPLPRQAEILAGGAQRGHFGAAPALEAAAGLCVGGICQRAAGCEGKGEPEQLLCESIDCIPGAGCLAALGCGEISPISPKTARSGPHREPRHPPPGSLGSPDPSFWAGMGEASCSTLRN